MCKSTVFLLLLATASVYCKNVMPDNVVPAHLDDDPQFQKLFPHIKRSVDTRIVGGQEAIPYSRPYQAGIIVPVSVGGSYFCGASLIDTMNLLTAAHCVDYLSGNLTAYLGAHGMLPAASENAVVVQTDDVIVHPEWDRTVLRNDIALIRLKEPVTLTARVNPILLPRDSSQDYLGNTSLVTGWGRPVEDVALISPVLNELSSHIMSNFACRLAYLGYVETSNICMASFIGRATCRGDSGGPLVVNGYQVGVVSFGSGWGCAQGYPSVFARVTYFLDWIEQNKAPIPETTSTVTTTEATTVSTEESTTTTPVSSTEASSTEETTQTTSSSEATSSTEASTTAETTSTSSTEETTTSTTASSESAETTTSTTTTTTVASS